MNDTTKKDASGNTSDDQTNKTSVNGNVVKSDATTKEVEPTAPGYEKKENPEVKETNSNRYYAGDDKNSSKGDDHVKM